MKRLIIFLFVISAISACSQSSVDYSQLPHNEAELSEQFEAFAKDRGTPKNSSSPGEQLFFIQGGDAAMLSMMAVSQKAQVESLQTVKSEIDLDVLNRAHELYLEEAKLDMPWVASEFASLYENIFAEEELLQIRAFFLSDVGQKWISKQSTLMTQGVTIGEGLQKRLEPRVIKRLEAEVTELKKN